MNPSYERIYHFHVRKTAGTSLNSAFWALGELGTQTMARRRMAIGRGLSFVTHDLDLIAGGDYFFGSSHEPFHAVRLPSKTFTVTILRDPVSRVLSYYRYLRWAREDRSAGEAEPYIDRVRREGTILDGGVRSRLAAFRPRRLREGADITGDTRLSHLRHRLWAERVQPELRNLLRRASSHHLFTQLHMFSRRLDPAEAAENVLACDAVCFTETFEGDLAELGAHLGLDLGVRRERSFGEPVEISAEERAILKSRLRPEYEMIERVRARRKSVLERSSPRASEWRAS